MDARGNLLIFGEASYEDYVRRGSLWFSGVNDLIRSKTASIALYKKWLSL